jgi:hypothetical protein
MSVIYFFLKSAFRYVRLPLMTRLCHVLCEYQFIICLDRIVEQLTYGYNASKIKFTIIENRCLVMCKIYSFCVTRGQKLV